MDLIELFVVDIVFSSEASSIVLKNSANGKVSPIHVSIEMGSLLLDLFRRNSPKRPDTFTLLSNCITSLGATMQAIIIEDAFDGIFFAKIVLNNHGTLSSLDARPSDAIALALVNKLPILGTTTLMKKLSWVDSIPTNRKMADIFFLCR
ncbi:MAG: bifunctional nuclease family protein [Puniceicoccales bacterium]|nr:bifunctional nuclease family protein [Puniceicoccales bacterium]